jgi:hypothetical protein
MLAGLYCPKNPAIPLWKSGLVEMFGVLDPCWVDV